MAKISINNLIPNKRYRMVIEPQFSDDTVTDANASIVFVTPKAPIHASKKKLIIDKTTYNAKNNIAPTQIVVSGTAGSQTVTVTLSVKTPSTLSAGKKTVFTGITTSGITALNGIENTVTSASAAGASPNVVVFTTSTTLTNGTYTSGLGTLTGTKIVKKPKLLLTIPDDITSGLIWNDTVRDVVYITYRSAATKTAAQTATRKYLNNDTFSFASLPTIPSWTSGQVKTFGIKVKDTNYYSFQFVIARYVRASTSDSWESNKFWLQGASLKNILSQQSVWGS